MKKAFTMIELVFVIVILGILAAVAIPRYFAMGRFAHRSNLVSFVSTLNRTVGEELWSLSLNENKGGSITDLASSEDAKFLSKYVQIPRELNSASINLKNCGKNAYSVIAESNPQITGQKYKILCRDGNATNSPSFELIDENGKVITNGI